MGLILKPRIGQRLNLSHPLANGLVGCWLMNEGGGNKSFDLNSNNITGSFVAGPVWVPDGIDFDAVNSYIAVNDVTKYIDINKDFTVVCKIKLKDLATYVTMYAQGNSGTTNSWMMFGINALGRTYTDCKDDTNTRLFSIDGSKQIENDGLWHTVALTKNSAAAKYYIDGVLDAQDATVGSGAITTDLATIGILSRSSTIYPFDNLMQFIYVFDCALTPSQIQSIYTNPYAMFEPEPIWLMVHGAAAGPTEVSLTLNQVLTMTTVRVAVTQGALTLAKSLAVLNSADATAEANAALVVALGITDQGQAVTGGDVNLSTDLGISDQSQAATEAALNLAKVVGITVTAEAVAEATLTIATQLALIFDYGAVDVNIGLAQSLGLSLQADATAEAALSLAYQIALGFTAQADAIGVVSLALQKGISTTCYLSQEAALSLAQSLGCTNVAQAVTEGGLTITQSLGIATIAQALAGAELSLSCIQSLTLTAQRVVAVLVLSDGRSVTVAAEVRVLKIDAEDRIISVNAENRIITVN